MEINLDERLDYIPMRVKDSNWKPVNMFNLIIGLSDISIIPAGTQAKKILALKWDGYMCNKYISPLLFQFHKGNIDENDICELLKATYKDKWNKSYQAMMSDYNPINNFDMVEREQTDGSAQTSGTSNTHTEDTGTNSGDELNKVYGYNSETGTNDSSSNTNSTNSNTSDGTDTNNTNSTSNEDRTLTKSGNIGVKTTQSLITEELNLRKTILLDEVYNDIVGELTISYYGYN